jgi:hypothetical protein
VRRAHVHYGSPFDCDADWTLLDQHGNNVYDYREHVTKQGGLHCGDETITITDTTGTSDRELDDAAASIAGTARLLPDR